MAAWRRMNLRRSVATRRARRQADARSARTLLRGDVDRPGRRPPPASPSRRSPSRRRCADIEADLVARAWARAAASRWSATRPRTTCWARASSEALSSLGRDRAGRARRASRTPTSRPSTAFAHASARAPTRSIAVGSGTINDLRKFAAAQDAQAVRRVRDRAVDERLHVDERGDHGRRPQEDAAGHATPRGVFIDLEVLWRRRRARMIRAGLGDSLCRATAQVDWLLSHRAARHALSRARRSRCSRTTKPALLDAPEALLARRSRRDARARAHARAVGPRHDALRRQLSREPGRASDQPLHRHVRAGRGARRTCTASRSPWRR